MFMNKQVRNKWGYAPIVAGFFLFAFGVVALTIQLIVNSDLFTGVSYLDRFNFWYFWAPIISYSLIAGALFVVVGIAILKGIRNPLSYASIAGGFILIIIDAYTLFINFINPHINAIGFSNLDSVSFFSYLMAGAFFIILGIIVGLRVTGKIGYVSITGGLAFLLLGVSILMVNLESHTSPNWYINLRYSWASVISYSLIAGALFVAVGTAYLIRARIEIGNHEGNVVQIAGEYIVGLRKRFRDFRD